MKAVLFQPLINTSYPPGLKEATVTKEHKDGTVDLVCDGTPHVNVPMLKDHHDVPPPTGFWATPPLSKKEAKEKEDGEA